MSGLESVVIGRSKQSSAERSAGAPASLRLQLADTKVSQVHAKLRLVSARWLLEDSGSTNGTILNGERVERAVLKDQDLFEVGYTFFIYRTEHVPAGRALPDVEDAAVERPAPGLATFSPAVAADFDALIDLAQVPVSVLIEGETGTGKELVARAVHSLSRRTGHFVAVNCGAIPESLFESELFGHRKGAFSAAHQDRVGLIREADKGTLFLDEIGELPLASQVKLLRVLQEQEVLALGASRPISVDIKVCAATNRSLRELVEKERFRDDLLARVSGFELRLPPLRQRREDLGLLLRTMLSRRVDQRPPGVRFTRAAGAALFRYHWPLNIRELESCLTTALTLAKNGPVGLEHLPENVRAAAELIPKPGRLATGSERGEHVAQLRQKLVELLTSHNGNISAVARALGRDRVQVRRWLRRFKLEPARFRTS